MSPCSSRVTPLTKLVLVITLAYINIFQPNFLSIHRVSCHRFPVSNFNSEQNDVISATFYVKISTQNAEKTKNSKATNPDELDSLWALDKAYWWILYIDDSISLETSVDLFHHTHCTHLVYEVVVPRGLLRLTTAKPGCLQSISSTFPLAGMYS